MSISARPSASVATIVAALALLASSFAMMSGEARGGAAVSVRVDATIVRCDQSLVIGCARQVIGARVRGVFLRDDRTGARGALACNGQCDYAQGGIGLPRGGTTVVRGVGGRYLRVGETLLITLSADDGGLRCETYTLTPTGPVLGRSCALAPDPRPHPAVEAEVTQRAASAASRAHWAVRPAEP